MGVNPIRPSELALPDVTQVRVERPRPQASDNSSATARPLKPVTEPAPDITDEVTMQWTQDSGVVLQFTDKKSGEVVRQVPSEQVLNVARFIRQLLQEQTGNTDQAAAITSSEANHG